MRPATRRQLLLAGAAAGWMSVRPTRAQAPDSTKALDAAFGAALTNLTGGASPRRGRVGLDIAPLVENGNTVPVLIFIDSPMTANEHVRRLALLTERNPQPEVAVFSLSPASGRAQVATRIRMATSQTVWALAELSDGSWWQQGVEVVVTLAACVEG